MFSVCMQCKRGYYVLVNPVVAVSVTAVHLVLANVNDHCHLCIPREVAERWLPFIEHPPPPLHFGLPLDIYRLSEVHVHLPYYIRSTIIHNMVGQSIASIYVYTTLALYLPQRFKPL